MRLNYRISKRQKFILTAFLLSFGLLVIELTTAVWRYQAIGFLALLTLLLSAWALREGLSGIKWLTVLILPVFFTASVGLFYFLIATDFWLARLPVVALYAFGLYALLLTENIFSVAAIRTIQLLRSAHAVGFLLTVVVAFFLYDTIFAFRLNPWANFFLVALVSFPLLFQGLWSIKLEGEVSPQVRNYSLGLTLVLGELALALSFWPVAVAVGSLALTTGLYVVLGLSQHELNEKLFQKTVSEYLGVGIAVLVILILTTRWGG